LEITWSEKLAQYLTTVTPILLGIGLLLMFVEFKTPGFGIFGISGLVVLSIVFFSQFVAGLSGHAPILFFLLGVLLLAVELLLFPGSFVIGLAGISLMLGSLVWSMTDLWPSHPISISGDIFVKPLLNVMSGIALAVVFFFTLLRFLPHGGLWSGMVLETAVGGEPPVVGALASGENLIGEIGIAATALFPSGQVDIGGRRYEARVDIGFAQAGSTVKVTGLAEFGLTVEVVS
ncbi:MAG: NfeD family protein, partial [Luteolibacter sp.]